MIDTRTRARLRTAVIAIGVSIFPTGVQAQNVVSAVESEHTVTADKDRLKSTTAGQGVATTYGGADTRALTDYGVNKIRAQGNSSYEQYATSAWVDSYTVGGADGTMVDLSFTVSIDGSANVAGQSASYNYSLYALRGSNWSAAGHNDELGGGQYNFYAPGDDYDRVYLNWARPDGGTTQMDARDFGGFKNFAPGASAGEVGGLRSQVLHDAATDTYKVTTVSGNVATESRYGPMHFSQFRNGLMIVPPVPYSQLNNLVGQTRLNLVANYSLLGFSALCADNDCGNSVFPGEDITVSFSLLAGSTFSLAGVMFADDVLEGTVDFYNTAKLTGVSLSNGATLTSASGALELQDDGSYGYRAVIAAAGAVPEPSAWALLILGFGLTGGAMRRRGAAAGHQRAILA